MADHKSIQTNIDKVGADLSDFEKKLLEGILSKVSENISTTGGRITGLQDTAGSIISKSIKEFVKTAEYDRLVSSFLKDVGKISEQKFSVYKDQDLKIPKVEVTNTQRIVINEYLDALNADGLNSRFNQSLRTLIYDNIRTGATQKELEASLRKSILSGKAPSELGKYVKQVSVQAADAYSKVVDQEVYNRYKSKITGFNIIGSLIETSSAQCKEAVKDYDRYLTVQEMKDLLKKYEGKTIENTTIENVSSRGLHWNCRHAIVPVIK